ncbi:hypothetical protein AC579_5840 [Pseudocercospora musae]|uniref:Uncharacterized protein n=1 Tax=Pseudocercospora musae TaxID=113226 RepID=A0A139ILI7_9PEZI|nr:hypothetical protein AC579_5840 [Pseudocercospora musae]
MLETVSTALVRNVPAFLFFRFLRSFFGSPILSTGGPSIQYLHASWRQFLERSSEEQQFFTLAGASRSGRSSGTASSRFPARNESGNNAPTSRGAPSTNHWQRQYPESLANITNLDPTILSVNEYLCLIYGIYYSSFEVFPLVYGDIYHFNLIQSGLAVLTLAVGTLISFICYTGLLIVYPIPRNQTDDAGRPKLATIPARVELLVPPIGIFLCGWSANPNIHWIVTMIGVAMCPPGVFAVFQALFVYMAI